MEDLKEDLKEDDEKCKLTVVERPELQREKDSLKRRAPTEDLNFRRNR